ncbi:MAG TPA: hypothetical protein ENJ82_17935 [Bacteroidetes bacterium]|nr:hypothetical protein [Bacteroidota bacterium]
MIVKKKLLFVLIGDDKTGKTTLQKLLVHRLNGRMYKRLDINKGVNITHPEMKRKYSKISFCSRSYQELIEKYGSVDEYFKDHFNEQRIAFISSHLNVKNIEDMIRNGKERYYNVCGVFFSNSIETNRAKNAEISILNWDERLVIENPFLKSDKEIKKQLGKIADNLTALLINKANMS